MKVFSKFLFIFDLIGPFLTLTYGRSETIETISKLYPKSFFRFFDHLKIIFDRFLTYGDQQLSIATKKFY